MLKALEIKGFKSHKDSRLEFSDGLNLIMGTGQAGKSNILDAFRLLIENRPLGGKYIHKRNAGEVEVKAVFDDCEIRLVKSIGKNGNVKSASYYLDGKKVASAIGTKVPDVIKKALNMSHVNYQGQSEESFLVTSAGGEFSKTVSKFVGIGEIEVALSKIKTKLSDSKSEEERIKTDISKKKAQLKRLRPLLDVEVKQRRLNGISNILDRLDNNISILNNHVDNTSRNDDKIKNIKEVTNKIDEYFEVEKRLHSVEEKCELLDRDYDLSAELRIRKSELLVVKKGYIAKMKEEGKCPYCFSDIEAEDISRIEEEL